MGFGAVADVLIESVFWVIGGEVYHIAVTGDFGDDGSGGDFFELGVGFNAGGNIVFKWSAAQKIDFAVDDNLGKGCVKRLN